MARFWSAIFLAFATLLVAYGLFGLSRFAWYVGEYFDDRLVLFDNGVYPFLWGYLFLLIGQIFSLRRVAATPVEACHRSGARYRPRTFPGCRAAQRTDCDVCRDAGTGLGRPAPSVRHGSALGEAVARAVLQEHRYGMRKWVSDAGNHGLR